MSLKTTKTKVETCRKELETYRLTHGGHEINEAIRNLNMSAAYLDRAISKEEELNSFVASNEVVLGSDPAAEGADQTVETVVEADTVLTPDEPDAPATDAAPVE